MGADTRVKARWFLAGAVITAAALLVFYAARRWTTAATERAPAASGEPVADTIEQSAHATVPAAPPRGDRATEEPEARVDSTENASPAAAGSARAPGGRIEPQAVTAATMEESGRAPSQTPLVQIGAAPAGGIAGVVWFTGTAPAPKRFSTGDRACPADSLEEVSVQVEDGRLANVFVVLLHEQAVRVAPPREPVVIEQSGCQYRPRVVGVLRGQAVHIEDGQSTLHNVHAYWNGRTVLNRAQPPKAPPVRLPTAQVGLQKLKCDVHPWMRGFVHVVETPFFAVSDGQGQFRIGGVPPGRYRLAAWHETLGAKVIDVQVEPGREALMTFEFSSAEPSPEAKRIAAAVEKGHVPPQLN